MDLNLIAGDRIVDGVGSLAATQSIIAKSRKLNLRIAELEIVTLAKRWEDKLKPLQFKSGASAMAALEKAQKLIESEEADLVVIKGRDDLKTGYEPGAREGFMKLYRKKYTPLDGYDRLVPLFLKENDIKKPEYFKIRDALFENYLKTWKSIDPLGRVPGDRWFEPLTTYFRGVDCANPNVDYEGQILVSTSTVADALKVPKKSRVRILGNAFTKLQVDGLESLPKIAPYAHLAKTIKKVLDESQVDFKTEFLNHRALLDAYTCYPVVPMALILTLKLVEDPAEIPVFLKSYEVTVTGGLNLGRAAWNLTSLNALIVMRERLLSSSKERMGLVHGNGSLGNQQGITLLGR